LTGCHFQKKAHYQYFLVNL